MSLERDVRHPLPVAWDPVEAGLDVAADALDVDAAGRCGQRTRVEDRDAPEVHVGIGILEDEERAVLGREAFVAGTHRGRSIYLWMVRV